MSNGPEMLEQTFANALASRNNYLETKSINHPQHVVSGQHTVSLDARPSGIPGTRGKHYCKKKEFIPLGTYLVLCC